MKSKRQRFEEGFTLIEAVIAVFILSLGSYLIYLGGHRLYKGFNDLKDRNLFITEAAQCNNLLKTSLNDIRFPYWAPSLSINSSVDEVTLQYLDGDKDSTLSMSFTENGFQILIDEENFIIYKTLSNGYIAPIINDKTITGLNVVFISEKENEYECKALFGGIPIVNMDDYE